MKVRGPEDLRRLREEGLKRIYPDQAKVTVEMATCGISAGANRVYEAIKEGIEKEKLSIILAKAGCLGFCQREPLVDVWRPGFPRIIYKEMTPEKGVELISEIVNGGLKKEWAFCRMEEDELLLEDEVRRYQLKGGIEDREAIPLYQEVGFYKKQLKIALRNCGYIDPDSIEEYIARGGYFILYKVLHEMRPEEVIEEVKRSGLRGRGGAGFPTGRKWESCRGAKGDKRYVVCNADEGDPGAYMDRSVLEGDPHSVLEGMIIGAYAIGAHEGYVYVRNEYPLAVKNIGIAIKQAEEMGLLGEDILGSGFDFTIKINRGGGAFVAGESTALMASIEGYVAEPRAKHIHTVESGLWDRPTDLNNVETWANVPVIIERGADWYNKIGTEGSKGTKVFSMVGKVNNTGLVEVPMGITLREIIFDIGGGIPGGKKFKAVQTGGPSGGCIPGELLDLPVDFDELTKVGSMMGSGGMIVMDESTCMVDVARYFTNFLKDESCGKCTSCRDGTLRMYEILDDITKGKGKEGDIELLEELGWVTAEASLCALGGTAPNPVLSTIRYFRDEYEAHIRDKRCPAGVCRDLITYTIDTEACNGCGKCRRACPVEAISGEKKEPHEIDQDICIKCGTCMEVCPVDAVRVE
ncbi:MAG: 4Fe-4S binding protein [Deltaproteobacteria bacterium]|nr:4Fe-4S binding protein [Deltaproteobacteria bacterium]